MNCSRLQRLKCETSTTKELAGNSCGCGQEMIGLSFRRFVASKLVFVYDQIYIKYHISTTIRGRLSLVFKKGTRQHSKISDWSSHFPATAAQLNVMFTAKYSRRMLCTKASLLVETQPLSGAAKRWRQVPTGSVAKN